MSVIKDNSKICLKGNFASDFEDESKVKESITKTKEIFNLDIANLIINNEQLFTERLRKELFREEQYAPFAILRKYVSSRKGKLNRVSVSYHQRDDRGRYFANNGLSLQSLPREIRGSIAGEYYYDIDMVNAHPMIFRQICIDNDIDCVYLTDLCFNRENLIKNLLKENPDETRDSIKQGLLSIINNGEKFYREINKNEWLVSFYKEVKENIENLCELNPELYEECEARESGPGKKRNPEGSTVNILFCIVENELLQIMIDYFKQKKVITTMNDYVMCFDGIMIERKRCKDGVLEMHMRNIEALFEKAGLPMKLKSKPFETLNLDIPEEYVEPVNIEVKESIKVEITNRFDFKDKYVFQDFYNRFNDTTFDSLEDLDNALIPVYQRVIAKIVGSEGVYIKKSKDDVEVIRKLGITDFKMYYYENEKKVKYSLAKFLDKRRGFGSMVCETYDSGDHESYFNIWRGWQAERVDLDSLSPEAAEGFEMIKKFIFEIWATEHVHYYNYIISWFAGLVSNKKGINRVALAMISKEGTGKNSLIDFMCYVLNKKNIAMVTGIGAIAQKHNTTIENKRLVLVNEVSSTKDEFRSNFDKIKSLITDEMVQIEPKGVNPYMINNIGNYIFFSNHADSLIVSDSDRRYAIFEMGEAHLNDDSYFKSLREKTFNQEVANAFYTYLLDFETVPLGVIPKTEIRQQLKNLSKSTPLKFLDYINEEQVYEPGEWVSAMELYKKYTSWCDQCGERKFSNTKFGSMISSIFEKKRSNTGMKYLIPYEI